MVKVRAGGADKVRGNSHEYERRLSLYLATLLETDDEAKAQQVSGLGPTARDVVIRRCKRNGGIGAVHPPGRPLKYTEQVLQQALNWLGKHQARQLSLTSWLQKLVVDGVVQPPADVGNFSKHLREYTRKRGIYINTTSTSTIFMLRGEDRPARLQFSNTQVKQRSSTEWDNVVFVDETTVEQCPHAKAKYGAVPHVYVSGVTQKPQRPFTGSSKNRCSLKLLVAIKRGARPIVIHLTGSKYDGCPDIPQYINPKTSKRYTDMSAEEYCNAIKAIKAQYGASVRRGQRLVLWHDRDTSHTAALTKGMLQELGVEEVLLPPRSPDLDPLDYGVFGAIKRQFQRNCYVHHMEWSDACKQLVADLRNLKSVDAVISEMPLRLRACQEAGGGHIEAQLAELKRQPR